jgi:hypothetical protein
MPARPEAFWIIKDLEFRQRECPDRIESVPPWNAFNHSAAPAISWLARLKSGVTTACVAARPNFLRITSNQK